MAYVKTDSQHYSDIADAIREKNFSNSTYYPSEMADAISDLSRGMNVNITMDVYPDGETWTRPSNYPDLDTLEIASDFDGIYLTYDLNRTPGWGFIGVYVNTPTNNTKYYVERGHLSNGEFIADYTVEQTKGTCFREDLDETNGTVQLWRVYSTAHITRFYFVGSGTTTTAMRYNFSQPCVERRGQLPYITDCSSYLTIRDNITDNVFGTYWLEKDNLVIGANSNVTSLFAMYGNCYRLVDVNLNWPTTNWKVTRLDSMFSQCVSLRHIDFSHWDTSGWAVTSLGSMFSNCSALQELDFSAWDTENWKVTALGSMFNRCDSLKTLDLSPWDTSGWAVTSMASMFASCRSLQNVIFTGWDTSKWAVTTLANMFDSCHSIKVIDLSPFDTTNWKVTTMASMFANDYALLTVNFTGWDTSGWTTLTALNGMFVSCISIKELDLSVWNTSNWAVTALNSMFDSCFSLEKLNINWITTSWAVTTLQYMFNYCRSLKSLDLSSWNTSNWHVTTMAYTFQGCYLLKQIKGIGNLNTTSWIINTLFCTFNQCYSLKTLSLTWNTSNWVVTTMANMFSWCISLEEIDLSDWDTSNWPVTAMSSMFNECRSLREIDLSDWDTSKFALTNMQSLIAYCQALETLYLPEDFTVTTFKVTNVNNQVTYSPVPCLKNTNGYPINLNVNWSGFRCLSIESLVKIINYLPTVTAARTLTLGTGHKNKLTAEQIAVATGKGWTVA